MSYPREGERQAQMPRWQTHTLIQFASPEVGKELLYLRYLTVTNVTWLLSFFADLGLPALSEGADIAALRHSVGHAQERGKRLSVCLLILALLAQGLHPSLLP